MGMFDLETLETERFEHVKDALAAMSAVCKDPKAKNQEKIDAAKVIAEINHAFVHTKLLESEAGNARQMSRTADKLINQLSKLTDEED